MPTQHSDQQWGETRDGVRDALRDSPATGVTRWLEAYIQALLDDDPGTCQKLVSEPFALPPAVADLVATRIRASSQAVVEGDTQRALELLTRDGAAVGPTLAALAAEPADAPDPADLRKGLVHGLTGVCLEAAGWPIQAAASYFQAGKRFGWLGEKYADVSLDLLNRSNELDASQALTYWHLADAWFVRAYADREALARAVALWDRGTALQLPDRDTSWVYNLRALLSEQMAHLDGTNRHRAWWEAVLFLERAILLDEQEVRPWAYLGRLHRVLDNEATALHATARAYELDANDTSAIEERAATLADSGAFDQALALIEQRLSIDRAHVWARGVKAYILMQQKQYDAALREIDGVLTEEPDDLWNLDVRATCCRLLGQADAARATYARILALGEAMERRSLDDAYACAFAAFALGQPDRAMTIVDACLQAAPVRDDAIRLLGLCQLVKGQPVRAEELLLRSVARANVRELDSFLTMELVLVDDPAYARRAPGVTAALGRVQRTTVALLAERRKTSGGDARTDAEAELTLLLEAEHPAGSEDLVRAGTEAGLARLQLEGGQWRKAAATYHGLTRTTYCPEARLGVQRAIDGVRGAARRHSSQRQFADAAGLLCQLLAIEAESGVAPTAAIHEDIGDAYWMNGSSAEALDHYGKAMAVPSAGEPARHAALLARIALVRQHLGDVEGARAGITEALRRLITAGDEHPGRTLGDACRGLLRDVDHFWEVDTLWADLEADPSCEATTRLELTAARESLIAYLDGAYQLDAHDSDLVPVVTPLALEVATKLVPLVDPKSDGGAFIYERIPAMRKRIEESTGMRTLPGVRVREVVSDDEHYAVFLDGARVARGVARVGQRFCPGSPTELLGGSAAADDVTEAVHPASGEPGFWCDNAGWEHLTAQGVDMLTETEFMLVHLEHVIRHHLAAFLGLQDAETLIVELGKQDRHAAFVTERLTDPAARLVFARALRALVDEQVPLTDWDAIVAGAQPLDAGVSEVVDRMRLALKAALPGNEEGTTLLAIPSEWQAIDVSPEAAHRQLVEIRRLLGACAGPTALIVEDARARRAWRRFIEHEFPDVAVLSREEVARPGQIAPATAVSAAMPVVQEGLA